MTALVVPQLPVPLPVEGPLTDDELRASPVPVSGPLTDAQLRADPIEVTGDFASDGLTNAELRAAPVPVDTGLAQPTTPADTQPVSAVELPLPTGAATEATVDKLTPPDDSLVGTPVTVGLAAVPLPAVPLANRKSIELYNNGTATIYVGGATVSAVNGMPVEPGAYYSREIGAALLFAISGTAGQNVRVLEAA